MFFDLQFSQAKFLELLTDQVQRALPLVLDEFDDPLGSGKLMIDHLDCSLAQVDSTPSKQIAINGPGGPTQINGNVLVVKLTIGASLTTRDKVLAAGHFGVPDLQYFGLWAKAEISASAAANGDIQLAVTPIDIDSILAGLLTAEQRAQLLAKMPSVAQTVSLPDVAGHPMDAKNAGLTLVGETVAVRAELSNPDASTASAWTSFYAGNVPVLGNEWAIQLPPELLVELCDEAITDAVDSFPASDSSVEIIQEPETWWVATGVASKAVLNAVDACPVGGSDIEFDLNFSVNFGLAGSKIQVTIDVSWDLSDWDVFRCAVATVLLPGAIITLIAGGIFGPIGAIVAAVLTIIGFIAAIVKISDEAHGQLSDGVGGLDPGDMNLHTVEQDDSHAVIRGEVSLGTLLPGMTATQVFALPTGLVISGTQTVPAHHERSFAKFKQNPFDWDANYSCSSHSWSAKPMDATVNFGDPNHYTLRAAVENLTVPPAAYTLSCSALPQTFGVGILTARSNLGEAGSGPDCEVLIRTNSGVRYANLGHLEKKPEPPPPEVLIQAKVACLKPKLPGPKKWLEAHWLVDPPPDDQVRELHVWDVIASQLAAGTPVEVGIVDAAGHTRAVGSAIADRRGQAGFRLITSRGENVAVSADAARVAVWAGGAVAMQVARLTPWTNAVDAAVIGSGDQARIAMATHDHVTVFGLDGRSLGRASIPGIKRVVAVGSRITAHDGARVVSMNVSPAALALHGGMRRAPAPHPARAPLAFRMVPTRSWMAGQEITELEAAGGLLAATLRDGTRVTLDRHLTRVAPPVRGARWLSEPALQAPLRVGTLIARVENGAVAVYRYRRTAVF